MKRFLLMSVGFLCCLFAAAQKTVTYPAVPGLRTSPDFTVKVNGQDVWTEIVGAGGM